MRIVGHHVQHEIALSEKRAETPFRLDSRIIVIRSSPVGQTQGAAVYILLVPPDFFRESGATFGQIIADSLAQGDLPHEGFGVSKRSGLIQRQIRIDLFPFSQDSLFIERSGHSS